MADRMASIGNGSIARRLDFIQRQVPKVRDRALASMLRGIKPEAARLIAADILNLPARQISPYLSAAVSQKDNTIRVGASKTRLPLKLFKPRASATSGVTVTTWKDRGVQHLPHAFSRDDKDGIWQRVPWAGQKGQGGHPGTATGLVHRLPIIERKGPSMHRIFKGRNTPTGGHGDILPRLTVYAQARLAEEVARMLKAGL